MLFRKYYFQFYFLPEFKGVKSVSVIVIVLSLIPFSSTPPSFWDLTSKTPTTNIKYIFHNLDNIFSFKSTPKKFQIMWVKCEMNYEIQFSSAILSHRLSWGLRFKVAEITELTKDGANTGAKQSWAGQKWWLPNLFFNRQFQTLHETLKWLHHTSSISLTHYLCEKLISLSQNCHMIPR